MSQGTVVSLFISPVKKTPMVQCGEVTAIAGCGLLGDRYCTGAGSYSMNQVGYRQVTLLNGLFIAGSGFTAPETRRNIITEGIELVELIGREFTIGAATFIGERYCTPCEIPSELLGRGRGFKAAFLDRGGILGIVKIGGPIRIGDRIVKGERLDKITKCALTICEQ